MTNSPQPKTVTEGELAEIRERAEKATAGPWEPFAEQLHHGKGRIAGRTPIVRDSEGHVVAEVGRYTFKNGPCPKAEANTIFIAHSRTDVIRLLDSIDSYRAEIERYRLALEEIVSPLKFMRERAEKDGMLLSAMAYQICNDPEHLKCIARQAIENDNARET